MISDKQKHIDVNKKDLEAYYGYHAAFYDLTRWSFLFGRRALINLLPDLPRNPRILEIGCGTGSNLCHLQSAFPDAHIFGTDLSSDMLERASGKVSDYEQVFCFKGKYGTDSLKLGSFDLILLSYTLTMTGNYLGKVLQQTQNDLNSGGYIAVVDFHQSPSNGFCKWMKFNHVDIGGLVLPLLNRHFNCHLRKIRKAYLGLWTYFQFIGQRSEK